MSLRTYRAKRDFRRTPEPRGGKPRTRSKLGFVVQKHAAQRLHYDFRLEHGGVLKSWAVPKGPSLDPGEKRLAVEVEDHPIEYGTFEGTIPKGEYGGGTVLLWDRGEWIPHEDVDQALRRGHLSFELKGAKLKGVWKLVRMGGRAGEDGKPNWLLMKAADRDASKTRDLLAERPESVASGRGLEEIAERPRRIWSSVTGERPAPRAPRKPARKAARKVASRISGARRAALPAAVEMQLPTLVERPPEGERWLHELKLDGYRVHVRLDRGKAVLRTRGGQDWSDKFPEIAEAATRLAARRALVDGEIVRLDEKGRSSFQALQRALRERATGELLFFAFDLLHLDGQDLSALPLERRKEALRGLLDASAVPELRFCDHVTGSGAAVLERACELAAEGIVSKRRDAPYRPGRGTDWVKTKCLAEQELVIGGYTDPGGSRTGFGALLLGYYEDGELRYAGRVGTGFDEATLADLTRRLRPLERASPPFVDPPTGAVARRAHWVRPLLVAQVRATEWTSDGRLRHPAFLGLREDKEASAVRRDAPRPAPAEGAPPAARRAAAARRRIADVARPAAKRSGSAKPARAGSVEVEGVTISNADRVLYPETGLTKLGLARYYQAVARWILPHVENRPLALVRCPGGRAGECFFQKHIRDQAPPGVLSPDVDAGGPEEPYVAIDGLTGLIGLVQIGVLEIHPWGSSLAGVEHPDVLIFDVDPAPDVPWRAVAEAARELRRRLEALGLRCFLKSTGGKGLHVVVPVRPDAAWDEAKLFCRWVVEQLVAERPDRYLAKASKSARQGKIFLDYLRNGRGATAVAPYSTRARVGAPVAVPLDWKALAARQRPVETVATLPRKLARRKDPWAEWNRSRRSLRAAIRRAVGDAGRPATNRGRGRR